MKALAFVVAVVCLTWVAVLWWWQRTGHSAELGDLLLYLGVLPLAVVGGVLLGRAVWQRHRALAPAAAPAAATAPAAAEPSADEALRHATLRLVQARVMHVAGEQPGDLLDAVVAGKPMPRPDAELTQEDGLPVVGARLDDKALDLALVRAWLDELMPQLRQDPSTAMADEPREHVLRALAALRPPLLSQRDTLLALHQARLMAMDDGGASLSRLPPAQRPPLPGLRVLLGWPAHWSAGEQALAMAFARRCLLDEDGALATAHSLQFSSVADAGEALWLRADQLAHGAAASPWLLVAACDSDLSAERVDALSAERRLYDSQGNPAGSMPGEAAAALLLAPAGWTAPADFDLPTVQLHRPALVRRDKPVDAGGRVAHTELALAGEQALAAAGLPAAQLGCVVSDADLHSPRSAELHGMVLGAADHLDPVEDMRLLGRITGRTGAAGPLLLLACAADAALRLKKPVLALAVADPQLRLAVVARVDGAADDRST